jgi:hypothetical protein
MSPHDYYWGFQTGAMLVGAVWVWTSRFPAWVHAIVAVGLTMDVVADLSKFIR